MLTGAEPREQHVVVLVVRQPGAGKFRARRQFVIDLDRADADDLRPYRPYYTAHALTDDSTPQPGSTPTPPAGSMRPSITSPPSTSTRS
jgi:hypothetical protein